MSTAWLLAVALAGARDYTGPTAVTAAEAPAPTELRLTTNDGTSTLDRRAATSSSRPLAPHPRVRVRWALDATITAGAAVPWLVLTTWVTRALPLEPLPEDPPPLGKLDTVARGRFSPRAAIASDVLLASTMLAVPLLALVDARWAARAEPHRRRRAFAHRWGTATLIGAEAIALTGLVGAVLKPAVGRPRPFTTLAEQDVAARDRDELREALGNADRTHSFPSAHAALAFAATTSIATTLALDAPRTRRARIALGVVWSTALLAAGTTAVLRVSAGRHYPSDVLTGAAIGSAIGIATPLAHVRWRDRLR